MPAIKLTISTKRHHQVLDITDRIERAVSESGIQEGLCNVFIAHTMAGLTTGESIEGTDEDLMETLERMIPDIKFRHAHDPSHAPDHMISSIVGSSLTEAEARHVAAGPADRMQRPAPARMHRDDHTSLKVCL